MLEACWWNAGSLVLGLIAWILAVMNLIQHARADSGHRVLVPVTSVSACAIALWMQIFSVWYLVMKEDWSALMDTSPARAFVATILLGGTLVLNAIPAGMHFRRTAPEKRA